MNEKIIKVFFDQSGLPFKDKELTTHFPIVGSGFLGASNTTKIRFYYKNIGQLGDTYLAISKMPNGKQGSHLLNIKSKDEDGNYVELSLSEWYFQAKGDVYISLKVYWGGVEISDETDPETGFVVISGEQVKFVTGAIKMSVNYAPIGDVPDYRDEFTTYETILELVRGKLDINESIYATSDISLLDMSLFEENQIFFDYTRKEFYKNVSGTAEMILDIYDKNEIDSLLADKLDKLTTSGQYVYSHLDSSQGELPVSTPAAGDTIAKRESDGRLKVATPTNNDDATTKLYVDNAISSAISSVYKYKGSVATYDDLPSSDLTIGDVYNVEDTGDNYAWTGTAWDKLAGTVDLSDYYDISQTDTLLSGKQNTLVSGQNIKTINNQSLLGSGNINIQGGSGAEWGDIGGNIAHQTDLQNELQDIREVAEGKTSSFVLDYDQSVGTYDEYSRFVNGELVPFANQQELTDWVSQHGTNLNDLFDDNSDVVLVSFIDYNHYDYFIFNAIPNLETKYVIVSIDDIFENNLFKVGDNVYVINLEVPDRWISQVSIIQNEFKIYFDKLETSKVDLDNYATKTEVNAKSDLTNVAPTYDSTLTYTIGEVVSYNGKIYKCTTAITTPESWDSTHWELTSVASDFVNLTGTQTITGEKTFTNNLNFGTTGQLYTGARGTIIRDKSNNPVVIRGSKLEPINDNTNDLGASSYKWKDLYLSGGLRDGNNANYGLTLPSTTNFTANKEIATIDQIGIKRLETGNASSTLTPEERIDYYKGRVIPNAKVVGYTYTLMTTIPAENYGGAYGSNGFAFTSQNGLDARFGIYKINQSTGEFTFKSIASYTGGNQQISLDNLQNIKLVGNLTDGTNSVTVAHLAQNTPTQWYGTQAQYDALETYDSNTIYNILES